MRDARHDIVNAMSLYEFLVVVHIIGTVLGVGAATFAEIHYLRFASDDIITDDEKKTLATTYTVLRFGLFLLVVSGFSFLLYYRLTEYVEPLTRPSFWAKMTIIGVLIGNAWALQARLMPLAVGSALSLTSWYGALVLGVIGTTSTSYLALLFYYAIAVVLVGLGLHAIRRHMRAPKPI